jgi:hypothetical protein
MVLIGASGALGWGSNARSRVTRRERWLCTRLLAVRAVEAKRLCVGLLRRGWEDKEIRGLVDFIRRVLRLQVSKVEPLYCRHEHHTE